MEAVAGVKPSASGTNPYLDRLVDEMRGKLVVLFGEPYSGKTSFAHYVAQKFPKNVYIAIDRNFPPQGLNYVWIDTYEEVFTAIKDVQKGADSDTLVVIDSLTTLTEDFLRERFSSPRRMNELSRFYAVVLRELSRLKEKGATVLVITHEAVKDFGTGEIAPSINKRALKHTDMVLRIVRNGNGSRKVVVWGRREIPSQPKFYVEGV